MRSLKILGICAVFAVAVYGTISGLSGKGELAFQTKQQLVRTIP